jgi:hypothetical protein
MNEDMTGGGCRSSVTTSDEPGASILRTDGPHSPARTRAVAGTFAETIRVLNYATAAADEGLAAPSTIYDVLGMLKHGTGGLEQMLQQMWDYLSRLQADDRLQVRSGPHAGQPYDAAIEAYRALKLAAEAGKELRRALGVAQTAVNSIGMLDTPPTPLA